MKTILLALAMTVTMFSAAEAQRRDNEDAIYSSRTLISLDRELNIEYDRAKRSARRDGPREYSDLVDGQVMWLNRRSRCGSSKGCLISMYNRRIRELRRY